MRKKKKQFFDVSLAGMLLCFLATLFLPGCGGDIPGIIVRESGTAGERGNPSSSGRRIYLVTMDLESSCWKDIDEGCRHAAEEIGGIDYKWIGPDFHDGILQSVCIDQAVADGAEVLLVAASSETGIVESLHRAKQAGVKIVYVDSPADHEGVATVMTDNENAGRAAAKVMKKALAEADIDTGTIGIVINKPKTKSTSLREKGFRAEFEGGAFLLADTLYMQDDPERAKQAVRENADYVAFFSASERTTIAVGSQVKASGTHQLVVGFDASNPVLKLVSEGVVYATMKQDHKAMGYEGMKIAVQTLDGSYTETNQTIRCPLSIITKDKV